MLNGRESSSGSTLSTRSNPFKSTQIHSNPFKSTHYPRVCPCMLFTIQPQNSNGQIRRWDLALVIDLEDLDIIAKVLRCKCAATKLFPSVAHRLWALVAQGRRSCSTTVNSWWRSTAAQLILYPTFQLPSACTACCSISLTSAHCARQACWGGAVT